MFNTENWKKHATFYLLLAFCVSLLFVKNAATHRGKHNVLHTNAIQYFVGGFLAGFTVHDGLEFDRWVDYENPIYISTNLHPLGKYQLRDIEWSNGYKRKFWNPQPPEKIEFWLRARVTGIGAVEFSSFTATVSGQTYGPEESGQTYGPEETEEDKVGSVVPLYPNYNLEENYEVAAYLEGPGFNTLPGEYKWSASGNVKIKPYTYGPSRLSGGTGVGVSFGWNLDGTQEPTPFESNGTWVVEHRIFKGSNRLSGNFRCIGCSESVDTQYAHRIPCANPRDNTKYYFCLQTEKWAHLYEETCSDANCADTGVYRCTHTHSEPSPPDYPEEDPPPPDVAGVCGHKFSATELTNHAPSVGSCGHTYSPCTPGNHTSYVCNISPCSNRVWWGCVYAQCPETSSHGTTTPTYHACGFHLSTDSGDHSWITSNSMSGYCTAHGFYACQSSNHISTGNCPHHTIYACDTVQHIEEQCTTTNSNGDRCTYTFWRCVHPTVPSYGPSHTHAYPALASPPVSLPVWSNIPDPYNLTVGDSFSLDLSGYVTGSPTITRIGGAIPAGLVFSNGVLSGTVTTVESRSIRFKAKNSSGSANSEWVKIVVSSP